MTQRQIEGAAMRYAEEKYSIPDADNIDLQAAAIFNSVIAEMAFIVGATSSQPEIDALMERTPRADSIYLDEPPLRTCERPQGEWVAVPNNRKA